MQQNVSFLCLIARESTEGIHVASERERGKRRTKAGRPCYAFIVRSYCFLCFCLKCVLFYCHLVWREGCELFSGETFWAVCIV